MFTLVLGFSMVLSALSLAAQSQQARSQTVAVNIIGPPPRTPAVEGREGRLLYTLIGPPVEAISAVEGCE